jgi:lysyl-tRNA synthetase class 2
MEQIRPLAPGFRFPSSFTEESAMNIAPLFSQLRIELPANPTTARLLDALASHLLEPLCKEPTFITHHPSIMSPLAKSFLDPETGHSVSARAELFVNETELINMYEEENDPFQQARNFLQQSHGEAALKDTFGQHLDAEEVKERLTPGQRYYVRVLEMGLPPTGGWGAGIERLVMHFGGAKKIGDVLPFGNLRNVVAMGTSIRPSTGGENVVQPTEV